MKKRITRRAVGVAGNFSPTLPTILKNVYMARGVTTEAELDCSLRHLLPPDTLLGIDTAVACLLAALHNNQRILIVGDFDADGATSCAVGVRGLRLLGFKHVDFLVPNRFDYGYGLTPEIVDVAAQSKPDLIVTVDNGIAACEGVAHANKLGINVVVTDHHLPGDETPAALAIVNPNQHGCSFASKSLAGVGVMFYLLLALRRALQAEGWFELQSLPVPNLAVLLDLVALGTVADVVPLDRNNRILVEQGLRRIRSGKAVPGILALLQVAGRDAKFLVAADLGFVVGPRLNAAGRLQDMSLGIRCLLTDDAHEARQLAGELQQLNQDRRSIETSMKVEADQMLAAMQQQDAASLPFGLCLFDENWHQGVIGILASRVKEMHHRPVIAFAAASDTELKGSARSIQGLHIRDALDNVAKQQPQLIGKFGGHAMAAGLTINREHFADFSAAFDAELRRQLQPEQLNAELQSDGELQSEEFSLDLAKTLRYAGPWGQGYPEPLFDGEFQLLRQRIVGERHLKMVVALDRHGEAMFDAIAFNVDLEQWPDSTIEHVKLAYRLDVNRYRDQENLQLMVEYLEPA